MYVPMIAPAALISITRSVLKLAEKRFPLGANASPFGDESDALCRNVPSVPDVVSNTAMRLLTGLAM